MSKHCYTLIWCIFKIVCLKMCMLKIFMSNDVYIKNVCAQKCVDQPELQIIPILLFDSTSNLKHCMYVDQSKLASSSIFRFVAAIDIICHGDWHEYLPPKCSNNPHHLWFNPSLEPCLLHCPVRKHLDFLLSPYPYRNLLAQILLQVRLEVSPST